MKKLFVLVLVLAMTLSLVACSGTSGDTTQSVDTASDQSEQQSESDSDQVPDQEPDQEPADETVTFTKDITMVVPWSAGGGTDTVARKLAENASKYLGVNINVENITGGSGAVGLAEVQSANPDGYTLAVLPVELSFLKEQGVYSFDFDNFTQICNVNADPACLAVSADSDFQSVADVVEYAKANPGKFKIAHSGTGFLWHLAAGLFADAAGIEVTYVPYDGSATGNAALLGGEVDGVTFSGAEVSALEASGDIRVLATFSDERMDIFTNDVPTMAEEGYDIKLSTFRGIGGPAGMDEAVVAALDKAFAQMAQEESFVEAMNNMGLGIKYENTEDYKTLCTNTAADMKKVCELLGLSK